MSEQQKLREFIMKFGLDPWKDQILNAEFTKIVEGKLINLDLGMTTIKTLPPDAFEEFSSIEMLNLSGCGLEDLPNNVFRPLKQLRILGLRNNSLTRVTTNHFSENGKLELINLEGNQVEPFSIEGIKLIF